jgi:hypothetical protein
MFGRVAGKLADAMTEADDVLRKVLATFNTAALIAPPFGYPINHPGSN